MSVVSNDYPKGPLLRKTYHCFGEEKNTAERGFSRGNNYLKYLGFEKEK